MRKQNRLRVLHVRHAGHRNAKMRFGLPDERGDQSRHGRAHFARGLLHEHAEIGGDEFVAAAARVQLVAERAEIFDKRGLDEMVHVLGGRSRRAMQDRSRARSAILSSAVSVSRISSTDSIPADSSAPAHTRSTASSYGSRR